LKKYTRHDTRKRTYLLPKAGPKCGTARAWPLANQRVCKVDHGGARHATSEACRKCGPSRNQILMPSHAILSNLAHPGSGRRSPQCQAEERFTQTMSHGSRLEHQRPP
jgi:hypothetical protein